MSKKLANEYMIWIESSTPGTFNVVRGQQGTTVNRQAASIDLTTKDDSGYGTSAPGLRSLSVTTGIIPNLPDTTGYTRLETLANAEVRTPFSLQIRKGGLAGVAGDVVFQCLVYGNLDSTAYEQNNAVTVQAAFSAAAAPTVDLLA